MPLSVLVVVVAAGLAVVIVSVHFFGGKRPGALDDETVRAVWKREFGEMAIENIVVSGDRLSACVVLPEPERLGVVCQMGGHHIARCLEAKSVRSVSEHGGWIDLRLNDTTLNRVRLLVDDDLIRSMLKTRFSSLREAGDQSHV